MYFILKILYKNFNVEALVLSKKHLAFGLDSLNHVKEKNANKNKGIFKNLYYNYLVSFLLKFRALFSKNKVRLNKSYLVSILNSHIIHYPTPIALTYAWSFGSLAGISLVIQMISGISLAMHYTPHIDMAFASVEYIMRDVPNGWLIRYIHSNGASMFFMVVYAHICRGIYYGSYMEPRQTIWITGMILFLLMMGTAFTGYVLPWGQISLWGATVITSMVTVLPVIGLPIAEWIWGGYTIKNPTINRFYVIHFILPFLIVSVTLIHLALLHEVGSNSPIGFDTGVDDVPFYPYFVTKDLFSNPFIPTLYMEGFDYEKIISVLLLYDDLELAWQLHAVGLIDDVFIHFFTELQTSTSNPYFFISPPPFSNPSTSSEEELAELMVRIIRKERRRQKEKREYAFIKSLADFLNEPKVKKSIDSFFGIDRNRHTGLNLDPKKVRPFSDYRYKRRRK